MDQIEFEKKASDLRVAIHKARTELLALVAAACPGPHEPKQHRDRKPPWCKACGRDATGVFQQSQD